MSDLISVMRKAGSGISETFVQCFRGADVTELPLGRACELDYIQGMADYSQTTLQSAERVLRVVQLLGERGSVRLTEVAGELGVSPSMAYRLLGTCCAVGFARQDTSGAPYEAGPAIQELALSSHRAIDLKKAGAQQLAKAAKELGETVSVCVLEGRMVRFVETIEGTQLLRVATPIGKTFHAHYSAAGRVMLAHLPCEALESRYPSKTLERTELAEPMEWEQFTSELERVRARGWAVQLGEAQRDIGAVAHVILDGLGAPRAALVCTVPLSRISTRGDAEELAARLEPYAKRIQRRLRGSH